MTKKNKLCLAFASTALLALGFGIGTAADLVKEENHILKGAKNDTLMTDLVWAFSNKDVVKAIAADGEDHSISITVDDAKMDFNYTTTGKIFKETKLIINAVQPEDIVIIESDNYKKRVLGQ